MWRNTYKDYPPDGFFIKEPAKTGRGLIGCEMHEIYGWAECFHIEVPKKKGALRKFLSVLFSRKKR